MRRRFHIKSFYGLEYRLNLADGMEETLKSIMEYFHSNHPPNHELDVYQSFAHWIGNFIIGKVCKRYFITPLTKDQIYQDLDEMVCLSELIKLDIVTLPLTTNIAYTLRYDVLEGEMT